MKIETTPQRAEALQQAGNDWQGDMTGMTECILYVGAQKEVNVHIDRKEVTMEVIREHLCQL